MKNEKNLSKGHYTKHLNKKNPCIVESKVKEMLNKVVEEKINNLYEQQINIFDKDIHLNQQKNAKNVREEGLDKFYTIPTYSKKCIDKIFNLYDKTSFDLIIEPSAGNGSFFNQLECDNKIGIDIEPENSNIIKMNFFDYTQQPNINNILVIGNPPFGKISSIAIKFFNHSAKMVKCYCFYYPKNF